jgi:redox-sensitive bicupin YhaK (pirin superfamily)
MSWNPSLDPVIPEGAGIDAIETVIVPRARDLGGFEVRRALPSAKRQMVGPFIFFDEMGPGGVPDRARGSMSAASAYRARHRDLPVPGAHPSSRSLGTDQWIEAGAVNLMTAGQGITHSERMDQGALPQSMWGLQTWLALPLDKEDAGRPLPIPGPRSCRCWRARARACA